MSLKRLSGLFKRKNKRLEEQEREEVQEQRQSLIGEMSENFQSMGSTMEQVQDHLHTSAEAMQHLPVLIQEQQELCKQVAIAQEANQGLLVKVQEYFEQRDQAQQALVDHVAAMNQQMREDAHAHKEHLQTLVSSYRGGRRMLVITIAFLGLIGTCLLTLLLIVALRPDLLGIQTHVSSKQPAVNPVLLEAQASVDPLIRQRADEALARY